MSDLLPPHGGYRVLRGFQVTQLVYDATLVFCDRFVARKSRTHDQMVQAARSGRQNIAEGSVASGTSRKTELKLTNVARASLEELLLDYEDFLRQRGLRQWDKDDPEALAVRQRYKSDQPDESVLSDIRTATPEVTANTMICLINQGSYLLHRQLQRLEQDFLEKGGFTERLYAARTQQRSDQSDSSDKSDAPKCPRCAKPMRRRIARQGSHAGKAFWGCTGYPGCKGTRPT
jgi:four helix bundle suffix protein